MSPRTSALPPMGRSGTRRGVGFRLGDLFPERHGFTLMVVSGRPLSRGHVLLRNADIRQRIR